jgi:hypothetical protein
MDANEFKIIVGVLHTVMEADKFHLSVAKRLLSAEPFDERARADLLAELSRREALHEQMEASVAKMKQILNG